MLSLAQDRKSTRLNSSHTVISYAVFCLIRRSPKPTHFPYTTLFRSILLKNAAKNGAEVHEETSVIEADITTASDSVTVTSLDSAGQKKVHRARFLVDASGRDAFIGAKNSWRKPREELDRTAIWSHWGDVKLSGGLEEGLSIIIYMGLEQKGWIWVFPLGENRITAGFVAQNSYLRDQQRKFKGAGSKDWKQDLCLQELMHSKFV